MTVRKGRRIWDTWRGGRSSDLHYHLIWQMGWLLRMGRIYTPRRTFLSLGHMSRSQRPGALSSPFLWRIRVRVSIYTPRRAFLSLGHMSRSQRSGALSSPFLWCIRVRVLGGAADLVIYTTTLCGAHSVIWDTGGAARVHVLCLCRVSNWQIVRSLSFILHYSYSSWCRNEWTPISDPGHAAVPAPRVPSSGIPPTWFVMVCDVPAHLSFQLFLRDWAHRDTTAFARTCDLILPRRFTSLSWCRNCRAAS